MPWGKRIRRTIASAVVVALLAVGAISATHTHDATDVGADSCVACRLVHSTVFTPMAVGPQAAAALFETVCTPPVRIPAPPRLSAASPRGPPSDLA